VLVKATIQKALAAFVLLLLAGVMNIVAPSTAQAHAQHAASKMDQSQPHAVRPTDRNCAHVARHAADVGHDKTRSHGSAPSGCHCIGSCLDEQSPDIVRSRSPEVITVAPLQTKVMIIDHHTRVPTQFGPPPTARYTLVSRHLTGAVRVLVTNMRLRN